MAEQADQSRVVIIGGGFGGLFAARALGDGPFSVTLVDRTPQHVFQPLLYQCATGILSEGQITAPLRQLMRKHRNVDCITADAVDLDADAHEVICRRPGGETISLPYDRLIVAAGVQQSYFGHDEFARWAPGMKDIADVLTIRRRVFGAFEMAETSSTPAEVQQWLTFALVGAGPTGVELAGQIRELATKTLRSEYRRAKPEDARVLLFDSGPKPLAAFGDTLSAKAAASLRRLGVELHMDTMVTNVDAGGIDVRTKDGSESHYDAATVLWTAGVEAPAFASAVARATGAQQDRSGRIAVQDDCTIAGHPEISVVGDVMSLRKLPGVAEVAMQSGLYAGRRVRRELEGKPWLRSFKYRDLGSAAYIARGDAVVSAGPLHLSGFPAWWAWLFIHIAFLTGYRNRLGAILTWWLAFTLDLRRERAYTTKQVGHVTNIYEAAPAGSEAAPGQPAVQPPQPRSGAESPAQQAPTPQTPSERAQRPS